MAIAVVGTGFIGPVHVEALRRLGRDVRGILGSSPEKSRRAAQATRLDVAYETFEDLLADEAIDVVHVASPNDTHVRYANAALEAGKHVVCEKPLALTSAETRGLLRTADAHPHLVAAVNYNIRFYPMVLHARELVRAGEIGEIYHVNGSYVQDWLLFDTDWNWRVLAEHGGAVRAVGDIGTHALDLMQFVTGRRIGALIADLSTFLEVRRRPAGGSETFSGGGGDAGGRVETKVDTEDYAAMLLRLAGGGRGTLHVSQVDAGRKNSLTLEIAGSKGSLAWSSERPNELWRGHRDRPNEVLLKDPALVAESVARYVDYPGGHNEGFADTFKQLYRAIYGYLDAGDMDVPRPFPTFADGHDEVLLCEAILQSHRSGAWTEVPGE